MTRRGAALRLVAAVLLTGCAAVLLVLARDGWHWGRAIADADARSRVEPVNPASWNAATVLPGGFVRDVLGIDDDLAYRRAVLGAIRVMDGVRGGGENEPVVVETELARIVLTDRDPERASSAADYLGVLLYNDKSTPQQAISPYGKPNTQAQNDAQTPEQKAAEEFEAAVRLDPEDANAKKNLETVLQQTRPPQQHGTPRHGNGNRLGANGAGARPPGFGY